MKITSYFTIALTKALKQSERITCQVVGSDIYVCNGYFAVKLSAYEYDGLVRPATMRDAGDWEVKGSIVEGLNFDIKSAMDSAAGAATYTLDHAPMCFDVGKKKPQLTGYYSAEGDFVALFNAAYNSIVAQTLTHKGKNPTSPMAVYDEAGDVIAIILPVRAAPHSKAVNAIKAYFDDGKDRETAEMAEIAKARAEELEHIAQQREQEIAELKSQIAALTRDNEDLRQAAEETIKQPDTIEEPEPTEATQTAPEIAKVQEETKMKTGDIVKISNAYSKAQNGLYVVITSPGDPCTIGRDYYLRRITKAGKISQSDRCTLYWPLRSWSNNRDYCVKADTWNKAHAEISPASVDDMSEIVAYFQDKGESARQRADYSARQWGEDERDVKLNREISAFYFSVVEKIQPTEDNAAAKAEAKPDPIRFYWNGIKVNGGKLVRCFYNLDNNADHRPTVSIACRDYSDQLPEDLFIVTNNTDLMTDYFDTDRTVLTPEHPLYKAARYAAECAEIRALECSIKHLEKNIETRPAFYARDDFYKNELADKRARLAQLQAHKNPGHPTAADIAAVKQLNAAEESARLAAEHAAELTRRDETIRRRNEGRAFIEATAAQHPVCDGAPVVTIHWSEHPAFSDWKDDELKLSVAAAEIILKHFDEERAEQNAAEGCGGYDKTSFVIDYTETNQPHTYEGRYDLGDLDGGLIEHIRDFGRNYKSHGQNETGKTDAETGAEIIAFADWLESYTAGGRVVSVAVAPWLERAAGMCKAKAQKQHEAAEQQEQQALQDLFDSVKMLTNEQLKSAVMLCNPTGYQADVARFFLQELYSRDQQEALETFRQWQTAT